MSRERLPICTACGMLYDLPKGKTPSNCKICDDPRQFVPPSGQSWTTLEEMKRSHRNVWEQVPGEDRLWQIRTEPRFPIGQRAFFIQTDGGNVLWDLIALLDDATVDFIRSKGGLNAIVISHPHFYTTYAHWAETFNCSVYLADDDVEWVGHKLYKSGLVQLVEGGVGSSLEIVPSVAAIKVGGHFPGSLVLHWENRLFIADSIMTVPSAHTPHPRPEGQTSYSFFWSIPNMIPMPPDDILGIWNAIEKFEFDTTYGAFDGMNVKDKDLKKRILQSMQIQVRIGGWPDHKLYSIQL